MKIESNRSMIYHIWGIVVGSCLMGLITLAAHAEEPTTIVRVRGKAGIAERVESRGKAAKENVVRVRLGKTIGEVVMQERTVVKGVDAFESKPVSERKAENKERPQPASVKPQVIEVETKGRVGK